MKFPIFFKGHKKQQSIIKGALVIALFSILSKILGLARYSLIAAQFGTGPIADSYIAAFRIPDFLYNALVLGALSTAFIPVFLDLSSGKKKKSMPYDLAVESTEPGLSSINIEYHNQLGSITANKFSVQSAFAPFKRLRKKIAGADPHWDVSNALLNTLVLLLMLVALGAWIAAPQIVPRMVDGFDNERLALTIRLTRIMLLSPIIFAASNIFGSILQAFKRFTQFALAPVVYNLGIIIGIVFLYPIMGPVGLAWGVVLGAVSHLLIQLPSAVRLGYRFQLIFAWQVREVHRVLRLLIPRALALSANQINQLVNTNLASGLAAGSLAIFYNSYDLQSLPVSLIAVSLAVASFPVLGEFFVQKKLPEFQKTARSSIEMLLLILLPLTFFMILLRAQIVRIILGHGAYNWVDTIRTLDLFGIFAASLVPQGLIPLLVRIFYAREETRRPVIIGVFSIAINVTLAIALTRLYGILGLALAFSISSFIQCALLWAILERRVGSLISLGLARSFLIYGFSAFVASVALYITLYMIAAAIGTTRVWSLLVQTVGAFGIGSLVYCILLWVFGDENIQRMATIVRSRVFQNSKLKIQNHNSKPKSF